MATSGLPLVTLPKLFVFAFVVMRPRPAARRTDIEKSRELPASLFAVEQSGQPASPWYCE